MSVLPPTSYVSPSLDATAFNCPNCGAYAHQEWEGTEYEGTTSKTPLRLARCAQCGNTSYWYGDRMIDPLGVIGPLPHPDMPEDARNDYEEARAIAQMSPRSAAGLLRLALEKLCRDLGETGRINDMIASLVSKGLPVEVQRAADALRVIGNEAVHPGTIDLSDDPETVSALFGLLNVIVEDRIARPKAIQGIYDLLPQSKRDAIEQRDGGQPPATATTT